jgi:hypothetical protein
MIYASIGCATTKREFRLAADPNKLGDIEFTHYLATVPVASVDEGMRAVLLLDGETRKCRISDDRRAELVRRRAFRESWKLESDDCLDKGTLAYMLRVQCELPRGLNEYIFTPIRLGDRRYALKTCIHEQVLPYGRADETVTGGELLAAVSAASEYVESRRRP